MRARRRAVLDPTELDLATTLIDHVRHSLGLPATRTLADVTMRLARLAAAHQVAAVLDLENVRSTDAADAWLRQRRLHEAHRSLALRAHLHRVVRSLTDEGVRPLVVKGVALAAQTGRSADRRAGTDLDILISPQDWTTAHRVLLELGHRLARCPPPGDDRRTRFVQWSYCEALYLHPDAAVDLHWRLSPGHLPLMTTDALWDQRDVVVVDGVAIPTLPPDAALAHVALHGAKDRWRSLRSTVDAHLLEVHGASWQRAADLAPAGRSLMQCRAGVSVLRSDRPLDQHAIDPDPGLQIWLHGTVLRPAIEADGRPTGGLTRSVVHQIGITPDLRSAAAILGTKVLPPHALAAPEVPARWWLAVIPARAWWLARRYAVIAARRLGIPLTPLPPLGRDRG